MKKSYKLTQICISMSIVWSLQSMAPSANAFDFDTGNAPVEVLIPTIIPAIYQSVSPTASDATLVLRITTIVTNAWFDAIAPYHPTAMGVYSNLGRRPDTESATNLNKNIAIFYATFRALNSLLPNHAADWRNMLMSVGLDPDDNQTDPTTAIGIGNLAGNAVVAARENDGMNQLGNEGGRQYNPLPYSDYLGYEPVNTAYELQDPTRWQPAIVRKGLGIYQVQQFVTPQLRVVTPYSYNNPNQFQSPPPLKSMMAGPKGKQAYKDQADEVLAVSASLTDEQKMMAEMFDDKLLSLGFSAFFVLQAFGLSLDEFVQYDFLVNVAAFDTAIAIWNQKYKWDAVRPFSAIQYLYKNKTVTAWGGPGQGTVTDLPASEWRSYLNVADHPEYPSGSASFCAAHAQASRRFLGGDTFGWSVPFAQGSSRIEPGISPAADIVVSWPTWTDFEEDCGLSRLWGGVHFRDAIEAGATIGKPIGDLAYEFVKSHIDGAAN